MTRSPQSRRCESHLVKRPARNITSGATFMMFWEQLSPGFDLYRMCKDGLYPISKYNGLRLELYYVVNFFAIAKTRP